MVRRLSDVHPERHVQRAGDLRRPNRACRIRFLSRRAASPHPDAVGREPSAISLSTRYCAATAPSWSSTAARYFAERSRRVSGCSRSGPRSRWSGTAAAFRSCAGGPGRLRCRDWYAAGRAGGGARARPRSRRSAPGARPARSGSRGRGARARARACSGAAGVGDLDRADADSGSGHLFRGERGFFLFTDNAPQM